MPIVTLTTDFGTADHYVAAMKGVILTLEPKATIVDVTHDLPCGGILQGAFLLAQLPPSFPPDTVHLAVVDPTVGSGRAILAVRAGGQFFVAPDNGLLTFLARRWVLDAAHAVQAVPARKTSATFHGRDIMAPAAARLARRGRLADLGPAVSRIELLDVAEPADTPEGDLVGQVIHVDHFGNCVTNIGQDRLTQAVEAAPGLTVHAGGHRVGQPKRTYADAGEGEPLALVGSAGLLEIAVNLGSAAERLGLSVGSQIVLRYE